MNKNFYCVIMAGGIGSRLWPVSRSGHPKQFLEIPGTGKSFLQDTYERYLEIVPKENIIVVSTVRYKKLIQLQLPELDPENLLLEPYGRNTAPCVAYASYTLLKKNPEATMVVSPADHIIVGKENFKNDVSNALEHASTNKVLISMGVKPKRADTNYGYIQANGGKDICHTTQIVKIKTFVEKPDAALAKVFMDSGEFFWNSGISVWRADTIIEEMERHLPEVSKYFTHWEQAIGTEAEEEFITRAYTDSLNVSLSYGVLEKTERAWLYPATFEWMEVGSWESIHDLFSNKDGNENAIKAGKAMLEDASKNLMICNKQNKLVAIKGLENFMVIDTDDVLLICPKNDKQFKDFISGIAMPEFEKYR